MVAYQWWNKIKFEMSYHSKLEKVILNGDQDITYLVKDLENRNLENT